MSFSQIEQAASGDRNAMMELLFDHQQQLGRFIARKLSGMPDLGVTADDIIQATFFQAFHAATSLKASSNGEFYSWLKTIADNQIKYVIRTEQAAKRGGRVDRDQKRTGPYYGDFDNRAIELVAELSQSGNTPSQFAARQEAVRAMQIAINSLPDDQQQAIRLHCIDRKTLAETAELMNRSTGSVHGLIQRAKKSLREMMHCSSIWLSKKQ